MKVVEEFKLDFNDVLIKPQRSNLVSRKEVDLTRYFTFRNSKQEWRGIPIMASNMDGVGTLKMANALEGMQVMTCLTKDHTSESILEVFPDFDYCSISTGIQDSDFNNLMEISKSVPFKFLCVDVANGYTERFSDFISKLRNIFPYKIIIAGNVVTPEMTEELIFKGADIVKVGIGSGSVCTTRIQTGVGYPQLSAIIECAEAAHRIGGHIMADGGCTCPGDVAKAFGAGADFVMLGGMLAGHDEGGGRIIDRYFQSNELKSEYWSDWGRGPTDEQLIETKKVVQFYGMSSDTAMHKNHGGVANYRSSEGRTVEIPYRGPVTPTIVDLLGGLRSTCTYVGARQLKELSRNTTFIRVGKQFNTVFV